MDYDELMAEKARSLRQTIAKLLALSLAQHAQSLHGYFPIGKDMMAVLSHRHEIWAEADKALEG